MEYKCRVYFCRGIVATPLKVRLGYEIWFQSTWNVIMLTGSSKHTRLARLLKRE